MFFMNIVNPGFASLDRQSLPLRSPEVFRWPAVSSALLPAGPCPKSMRLGHPKEIRILALPSCVWAAYSGNLTAF